MLKQTEYIINVNNNCTLNVVNILKLSFKWKIEQLD